MNAEILDRVRHGCATELGSFGTFPTRAHDCAEGILDADLERAIRRHSIATKGLLLGSWALGFCVILEVIRRRFNSGPR